jgi:hypothetical protein
MVQAGRSRVPFPMRSLDFSIHLMLPAALWHWGRFSLLTEMITRNVPGDKGRTAREADNLTDISELFKNVGASTSRNPMGLHGLSQG